MKRIVSLLFLCALLPLALQAQSYSALWKKAAEAQNNDLPRSALDVVVRIQQKAESEGNTTQLIRALCTRVMLGEDISNDSVAVDIGAIKSHRDAERRPVERALWNAVLAQMCQEYTYLDTSYRSTIEGCYTEIFSDMNALSKARTSSYMPLFTKGKHSAYFKNDVLHVLARQYLENRNASWNTNESCLTLLGKLAAHYKRIGNREAALLWRLDSMDLETSRTYSLEKDEDFLLLQRMARENRDLKLNVLTYVAMTEMGYHSRKNDSLLSLVAEEGIRLYGKMPQADELRNYLKRVRQPELSLSGVPDMMYPGNQYTSRLHFKALNTCEVRLYRLDGQTARSVAEYKKDWRTLPRTLVRTFSYQVHEEPPYVGQDTTVSYQAPDETGVYAIFLYDGKKENDGDLFHCTRLKYMLLELEAGKNRVSIVDAMSGKPVSGTHMELCTSAHERNNPIVEQIDPASDGYYYLNVTNRENRTAYVTYGSDTAMPSFSIYSRNYRNPGSLNRTVTRLYTDRGIYRPGQQVIFGGFTFTQNDDSMHVEAERSLRVSLYDSHGKLVGEKKCTTDAFGSFEGTFDLPTTVLPGDFVLKSGGYPNAVSTTISVQEYKRPTFTVELDPITRTYQPGDTLLITGTARTYSGLPVEGARVAFETQRYEFYYWYRRGDESSYTLQRGDTLTDSEGRFCIPVVLTTGGSRYCRTFFSTRIDVTAQHGETQNAWQSTYVSYRTAYLSIDWPETVCFERMPVVTPRLLNAQGLNVDAVGTMTVSLDDKEIFTDSIRTGQPIVLTRDRFPQPGKYLVTTTLESNGETFSDKSKVRFFSEYDTRPASDDEFWYNIRNSENGDSAYVIIGSALRDVTMFYDVYTDKKLAESRLVVFSDSLLHYALGWRPEYGDAARVSFAFVKDHKLYTKDLTLVRPKPDKRLQMGWVTFRSLLTPGQHEEWKLRVSRPDGQPVKASVMARLYDASIDALRNYQWSFSHSFRRYVPSCDWRSSTLYNSTCSGRFPLDLLDTEEFRFTEWNENLFSLYADKRRYNYMVVGAGRAIEAPLLEMRSANYVVADMAEEPAEEEAKKVADGEEEAATVVPRTNFNETAFFYPTMRTEENGELSIAFTLPESLTQWNFRALAHTEDMCFGNLDTLCVARKEFMVEPAMPRFVREGDKAQILVTVRNLTDKPLNGTLLLQVLDAATEKVIMKQTLKFDAPADGSQVQIFTVDTEKLSDAGVVTVRVTGKSGLYGDGEEHYLPVLSAREQVTGTLPFTLTKQSTPTLRIDTLWSKSPRMANRRLTIEATSNPTWYAVTALPVMADRQCYSSTDWAERLYAVILAKHIAAENPAITKAFGDTALTTWASVLNRNEDLKNTLAEETPWLVQGEQEARRAAALADLFDESKNALKEHTALDKLRSLQKSDGSWSWCPGMSGSVYMTSRIAVILARLQKLTGYKTDMLSRAFLFLESEMDDYVKEAKKKKYKGCPYELLRYLYAAALTERTPANSTVRNNVKFLVEQIEDEVPGEDMHTKSLCAVVLSYYGKDKTAQIALQSLLEHTSVGDPMYGRFFDTHRAPMTWGSYRIPTQTSTMEALIMAAPEMMWNTDGAYVASRDQVLTEMRLWLLQSKRTQMWETSSASLDAIYALLLENGKAGGYSSELTREADPLRYTLKNSAGRIINVNRRADIHGEETLGYICDRYTETPQVDARSITLSSYNNSVSWGSVYASYTLPVEDVVSASKGLGVTRRMEVRRDGTWQAIDGKQVTLKVGERVRVIFTLTADRDYDYVNLRSGRPACTEPTDKLSGYRYTEAGGCYRVVRDTDLQYFFEKMRKGTHTFTDELVIDRAGIYTFAPSRLQSLYSPEFQGISTSTILTVEQ